MMTLLGTNGYELDAADADVVAQMVALADGTLSEDELAEWIRRHIP
jgi:prophage maintenance system killer protein